MSGDPRPEFLVRDPNHGSSAFPTPKSINRKRPIGHHAVGGSSADSQFPLHFARAEQPVICRHTLFTGINDIRATRRRSL